MTAIPEAARPQPDETSATLGRAGTAGLYALVALRLAEAGFWALIALSLASAPGATGQLIEDNAVTAVFWALAAIDVLIVVGLLLRQRWAWVVLMLVTGLGLLTSLVLIWNGQQDTIRLAIQVATALFLNQRSVRIRFGVAR